MDNEELEKYFVFAKMQIVKYYIVISLIMGISLTIINLVSFHPEALLNSIIITILGLFTFLLYYFKKYHESLISMIGGIMVFIIIASYITSSAYLYSSMAVVIFLTIINNNKLLTHLIGISATIVLIIFVVLGIFTIKTTVIQPYNISLVNNIQIVAPLILITYIISIYTLNVLNHTINLQEQQYLALEETQDKLITQAKLDVMKTLASGMSHDFNNTLSILFNYLEIMASNEELPDAIRDMISTMDKAVINAQSLSTQLVNLVKTSPDEYKIITNLDRILIDTATFSLVGSKTKLKFQLNSDPHMFGDELQISQVIQNFILNAKQAMNNIGEIMITLDIIILDENNRFQLDTGEYLEVHIIDNGSGIPSEIQDKIFDLFYTTKNKGSGIGLCISKRIVTQHGGYIGYSSEVNKGSDFYFILPTYQND